MKKSKFMEKYPVYTVELLKQEIKAQSIDDILDYFKIKIEEHPASKLIAVFNHFTHTKNLDGEIMDGLLDAQNIIFCFGTTLLDTKMTAVRPRSLGVCELDDKFVIEFMEIPREELNALIEFWIKGLLNNDEK